MSDSILHYTLGLFTAYASAIYTLTFLVGVFLAARYNKSKATLWASLALLAVGFYVRSGASPVGFVGVSAMIVVHVTGGCLIGLWLRRKKAYRYQGTP